jgi:hypothetical protein
MSSRIKYILLAFIIILFNCCSHSDPPKQEIIGVWVSEGEVTIEMEEDGSIKINNYPLNLVHSDLNGFFDGVGRWEILKTKSISPWWIIDITAKGKQKYTGEEISIGMELMIARTIFTGKNSGITNLFVFKGDPDLNRKVEFHRRK